VGQATDAAWRVPAEERIQQIRKGQMNITVYDSDGTLVENADVHIEMEKHQFGFGTAIAANELNSNETYRNTVLDMFNEVVFENDLKWPQLKWINYEGMNQAFDTLEAHGIAIRGHNIIWPSYRFMPDFMEDLANDPEGMRTAIDEHIDEITTYTKGKLVDWDVINEPYSEHDVMDILGDEVMADWFKRTRQNDRGVKLYLNEYSIINSGGNNVVKQDYLYNLIQEIDNQGGAVDGIGIQGHFGSELTSISKIYDILDRYAFLGKEIKITEHDIDLDQRGVQADYTRDFMTILFSHPSVKSLLVWGFWEGRHWKPEGAFFNEDWSIRPHGEVWNDMIKNKWWTLPVNVLSDAQGQASFEGFLGTYSYTVSDGTSERSGTFTLDNSFQSGSENSIVISLDAALPESVSITPDKQGYLCAGEEITLSAPLGDGLIYEWTRDSEILSEQTASLFTGVGGSYQVTVSKNGVSCSSEPYVMEVRTMPEPSLDIDGSLAFCKGETVTFLVTNTEEADLDWYKDDSRFQWGGAEMETGESGNYGLKVSENGCSVMLGSHYVSVNEKVDLAIEALGNLVFCEGEDVIIRTHPDPGVAYS
jgi:GH35 family endo-1,4-beta-xylanase